MAPAIVWAALVTPLDTGREAAGPGRAWMRAATVGALALIGLAYLASLAGATFYERARSAVAESEYTAAREALEMARALDPSLALYARAAGVVALADDDAAGALEGLERAVRLAPADDQAWRALAIAHDRLGNAAAAGSALNEAINRQRSDPANLLLSVQLDAADDRDAVLAELVLAWPQLLAAPGWDALAGVPQDDIIAAALERWRQHPDSPEREVDQAILLAAWVGRDDLLADAMQASPLAEDLALATAASAACDPSAGTILDDAPAAVRRSSTYWALRIREADDADARAADERAYAIMTGRTLAHRMGSGTINPLASADLAAFNLDEWGYRRPPFPDVAWPATLPSPNAGRVLWIEGAPIGRACAE
jgi:hypothetical protein